MSNDTISKYNCECCICKKPLYRKPSQLLRLEDGKPVCSEACRGKKKTQKYYEEKYECCICGTKFYRAKNQIDRLSHDGLTCSRECGGKFKTKKAYEEMCDRVGTDFKDWLINQYSEKELPIRILSKMAYGTEGNSPNILGWMKKLDIPTRSRTDAVALQWKDNFERKIKQSIQTSEVMASGTPGREKLIKTMRTDEYRRKSSLAKRGAKNPMWNGNLSEEERADNLARSRTVSGYLFFRRRVYERDHFTCQKCSDNTGGNLVVHHINSYAEYPEQRTEVSNGITLCESCHKEYHKIYGIRGANEKDFNEYMSEASIIR